LAAPGLAGERVFLLAIDHPDRRVAASKLGEGNMQLKKCIRAYALGALIVLLGISAGPELARAQQEGPAKPGAPQQQEPAKPPTGQKNGQAEQQKAPQVTLAVETNLVNIDAVVTDNEGNPITGLKKENFRVLDNNQPQQVTNFAPTEAPITIVMLMEFSDRFNGYFAYKTRNWSWGFLNHLNQKDWVALKIFDLKTDVLVDFTQDKREVQDAIAHLLFPTFHEAVIYDALIETIDQLKDVKGKKSVLLLTTGGDTFSKHTLDQTYKRLKETDVTIFSVGMGEEIDLYNPRGAGVGYLQAKNILNQFAEMTGGYCWFPRFEGEMPGIFSTIAAYLRSQYTIGFSPSSGPDGKFHHLKVEIVDEAGNPLQVADRKGHKKKVVVYARNGYASPKPNSAD
jgi:VWFA-related protein